MFSASINGYIFNTITIVKECFQLKLNKVIKTAIKYGPIIYPIIKKVLDKKSTTSPTNTSRTPKR